MMLIGVALALLPLLVAAVLVFYLITHDEQEP